MKGTVPLNMVYYKLPKTRCPKTELPEYDMSQIQNAIAETLPSVVIFLLFNFIL
jgi:hypothetical protein